MSPVPLGLTVQGLDTGADRVAVVGYLAGVRNGQGWFRPRDVHLLFDQLRVPRPVNVSVALARLAAQELAVHVGREWALSPTGEQRVHVLLAETDVAAIGIAMIGTPGTLLGNNLHSVLAPAFAPSAWVPAIERMLQDHPFESNVFLMTRFPQDAQDQEFMDPIRVAIPVIRESLARHGLTLHLASDRQLADDLLGNVAAHMWACQYGVGVLEDRLGRGLNYNVLTEIGAMLMTGRRCALLKDESAPELPTDLAGQIYKSLNIAALDEVERQCHRWAANDLGLGACVACE